MGRAKERPAFLVDVVGRGIAAKSMNCDALGSPGQNKVRSWHANVPADLATERNHNASIRPTEIAIRSGNHSQTRSTPPHSRSPTQRPRKTGTNTVIGKEAKRFNIVTSYELRPFPQLSVSNAPGHPRKPNSGRGCVDVRGPVICDAQRASFSSQTGPQCRVGMQPELKRLTLPASIQQISWLEEQFTWHVSPQSP